MKIINLSGQTTAGTSSGSGSSELDSTTLAKINRGDSAYKKLFTTKLTTSDFQTETKALIEGAVQTESDPTISAWAKATTKPTYTAAEVGALPSTTNIPSKTSDLTNDSNFVNTQALSGKVDKVTGMGLSENSYTTAEKTALSALSALGIAFDADSNVLTIGGKTFVLGNSSSSEVTATAITTSGNVKLNGVALESEETIAATETDINNWLNSITNGSN